MSNAATALLDANLAHEAGLRRLSNATLYRVIAELNRAIPDLERQIKERIGWIAQRGYKSSDFTLARLEANLKGIKATLHEAYVAAGKVIRGDMMALVQYEAKFQQAALANSVGSTIAMQVGVSMPTPELLRAIVQSQPFQGGLLRDWAKKLEADAFANLRQSIRTGLVQQESIDQIVRRAFGRAIRIRGEWTRQGGGFDMTTRNAEAVVRTATSHVVSSARQATYEQNQDLVKGYVWSATLDSRTTQGCAVRDGLEWNLEFKPVGHSVKWEPPPRHWNCLLGDSLVAPIGRVAGITKRWVESEIVVLYTASGLELSCTPNHPILTDHGWVAAGGLDVGGNVVRMGRSKWPSSSVVDHKKEHAPSRIEDLARSFIESPEVLSVEVPASSEDFHGDGMGSQVYVVAVDRELCGRVDPAIMQELRELALDRRYIPRASLSRLGHESRLGSRLDSVAASGMSPIEESMPLLVGSASPSEFHLLTGRSGRDAGRGQPDSNGPWRDVETIREWLQRDSGEVEFDKLISIQVKPFRGHVYNLLTESGIYCGNSIIVHNCRSTYTVRLATWKELGIDADELTGLERQSMDGKVPVQTSYGDWLARQKESAVGRERIVAFMGQRRGDAFIRGDLGFDDLFNSKGEFLSIQDLARIEGIEL